jgi:hypothetical protein
MDFTKAIEAGYVVDTVDEGVYLIKDFITEEERESLHERCVTAQEAEWQSTFINNSVSGFSDKNNPEALKIFIENIKKNLLHDKVIAIENTHSKICWNITNRANSLISHDGSKIKLFHSIQRHYPGSYLQEHSDKDSQPGIAYASVIYLNDDYNNGELYFPDRGIEIKPPARSLVIFDSGKDYVHGVRKVGEGPTRYVLITFAWN